MNARPVALVAAASALAGLGLCAGIQARMFRLAIAPPSQLAYAIDECRHGLFMLSFLCVALPSALALRVVIGQARRLQDLRQRIEQLLSDPALEAQVGAPKGEDEVEGTLNNLQRVLWTQTQKVRTHARAVEHQQQIQLQALQSVESAEALLEDKRTSEALAILETVPGDLGKISRKARALRIDAIIELGHESKLEAEVRRGQLASLPPPVMRKMARQFEELERYDLALDTMNVLLRLAPENRAILHDRDRLAHLSASLEADPVSMELIRRSLGNMFTRVRFHAAGGMSIILKGILEGTTTQVAIKLLQPSMGQRIDLRRRLERELRVLMKLEHPNIVRVLGPIEGDVVGYYMELLEGEDLAMYLDKQGARLPLQEASALMLQVVHGLHYAHEQGFIHRDVKPGNFIRSTGGRVKLVDFGIAYVMDGTILTQSTGAMGTPGYMAPEQIRAVNTPIGEASDVYALGVMLFEMLSGQRPYADQQVMVQKLVSDAPSLADVAVDIPAAVVSLVDRCLVRDPAARTVTCDEFARICERYANPESESETVTLHPA